MTQIYAKLRRKNNNKRGKSMSYADQNLKDIYQYHSNFERSERVYLAKKVAIMSILLIVASGLGVYLG